MSELTFERGGKLDIGYLEANKNNPNSKARYTITIEDDEDTACIFIYEDELKQIIELLLTAKV